MNLRVLTLATPDAWDAALLPLPGADVYHLAAYHQLHERNGEGEAVAWLAEEAGHHFAHVFLKRPILRIGAESAPAGWFDLESVYGYSGPLADTAEPAFLTAAWNAFHHWCRQERVVCEFCRFNPLSGNERLADPQADTSLNRQTVVLDLDPQPGLLWDRYPSVQRNMVRKAEAQGLTVHQEPAAAGLDAFLPLYHDTMQRLGAGEYYTFSAAYFEQLRAWPQERLHVFTVRNPAGAAVAAALILAHAPRLHYHLAGTDAQWRQAAPANLLLHAVALWGGAHGFTHLHLGGGRTAAADDALLRFKASLSRQRLDFYVSKRIHLPDVYQDLCQRRRQQPGLPPPPAFFQLYRA